jgi:HEAT repeat protein
MPIVPSKGNEIKALIAALADRRANRREAALAKLTLLGERSLPHALEALRSPSPLVRFGALAILEGIGTNRVLPHALLLLTDADERVAVRAAQLAGAHADPRAAKALGNALRLRRPDVPRAAAEALVRLHDQGFVEALEPLLDVLFDEEADDEIRLVALGAVARLPVAESEPLLKRLGKAGSRRLSRAAAVVRGTDRPDDATTIPALHREIERLSAAGSSRMDPAAAAAAKADVHLALARLDSRIALYDLREMLEARPLRSAGALLQAAGLIGDKSLVATLARLVAEEPGLIGPCAEAFGAIVRRGDLRRASPSMRRVKAEHQPALARLWAACSSRSA